MYAVVLGNPIDGITIYGPFESFDEAGVWCESTTGLPEYYIVDLLNPLEG